MRIDFCVPVYNEEKILGDNIKRLKDYLTSKAFSFSWKIIIINNGSTDGSQEICKKISDDKIFVENVVEAGKGMALKTYWEKSRADIIAYMDVDLAVSLDNIEDLLKPLIKANCDMTIGSRLLSESKITRSIMREFSSQSYNLLSRLIIGHKFSDSQCGFKAFRTGMIRKILPNIKNNKFFFDTELVVFANYYGYRIREIPVEWEENRYEQRKSKVNIMKDGAIFIVDLVKLKFRLLKLGKQA